MSPGAMQSWTDKSFILSGFETIRNEAMRTSAPLRIAVIGALLILASCGPQKPPAVVEAEEPIPEQIDFNFHVKPILSDRCFKCHGPDNNARKTDLRFDTEAGAFTRLTESARKYALVPGSLSKSELFHRLTSDDPEYVMPPPESNLALTPEEIAILLKWIEQGAKYKSHWSLIRPEHPDLPAVEEAAWPRNGIDHFILDRLEEEGLSPSDEAAKETLLRRVTFDLTGLPPTLDEIDAFLADDSPDAYETVVDRLLASDAYGERMATEWLDLARYADSHGYQDDGMRNMWPWRDWVIEAFNKNLPFDEFVIWQLAGDLLPDATHEQRLATGFNRNHLQSQEGGIVPEEYRVEYVADRTNTFGKAFLGLTVECARCHEHKFDPIDHAEYYQLFGFFNSVNEFGNIPYSGEASPTVILIDEETQQKLAPLNAQIREVEAKTAIDHAAFDEGFERWLGRVEAGQIAATVAPKGLVGHYPLDGFRDGKDEKGNDLIKLENQLKPANYGYFWGDKDKLPVAVPGPSGTALKLRGDGWLDMGKDHYYFERNESFTISLWFNVVTDSVSGPLFSKTAGLFNGRRGYVCLMREDGTLSASLNHVFPDNSIEIETLDRVPVGQWNHLAMTYDGSSRAAGIRLFLNGQPMASTIKVDNLKQSILYAIDPATSEHTNWGESGNLRIGFVGGNSPTLDSVMVDEFKIFDRRLTTLEVASVSGADDPLGEILAVSPDNRTAAQKETLRDYYVTAIDPEYRRDFDTLTGLRGEENDLMSALPEVMVMRDLPEPRPTHILDRGAYDAPTERVEPGTPASVMAFPDDLPKNRLGLAQWLVDPGNPLPARVTVNRYWQLYFGTGLVATPDDFGSQGALPTHPLLLDWLATTFAASGWDVKALQKLIVTSATYRQSSVATPALLERDPDNVLLARGPSYRMPAEMIRDQALASSGLMVRTIGGPPVKPYQPKGLWKELATRNATEYEQDHGEKLYRRSMYTIWKRTSPPPSMMNFDMPERNFCTVRRQSTSTPLQSLVLLNDPQYVEAARLLAERLLREGRGGTIEDRLTFAFRLLTSRPPLAHELSLLTTLYEAELETFQADRQGARALLSVGEYPRDEQLDLAQTAALTVVASTLMNFDEAVMKR